MSKHDPAAEVRALFRAGRERRRWQRPDVCEAANQVPGAPEESIDTSYIRKLEVTMQFFPPKDQRLIAVAKALGITRDQLAAALGLDELS